MCAGGGYILVIRNLFRSLVHILPYSIYELLFGINVSLCVHISEKKTRFLSCLSSVFFVVNQIVVQYVVGATVPHTTQYRYFVRQSDSIGQN